MSAIDRQGLVLLPAPPEGGALNSTLATARLQKSRKSVPRRSPGAACLRCRKRKVRCDGSSPCSLCKIASLVCTYDKDCPAETVSPMDETYRAHGLTLFDSFRRVHYLEMYLRYLHVFFPILTVQIPHGPARTLSDDFQESVALYMASRSLGHMEVFKGVFHEARVLAGRVKDDPSDGGVAAMFMMGMSQLGEDNPLARFYLSTAHEIVAEGHTSFFKMRIIDQLVDRINLIDAPYNQAALSQPCLTHPVPFPARITMSDRFTNNSLFEHPVLLQLVNELQRFPVHSPILDMFGGTQFFVRHAPHMRSNAPLDAAVVHTMLHSVALGEISLVETACDTNFDENTLKTWLWQQQGITWGVRLLIVTVGGITGLGSQYARQALECVQSMSYQVIGFNRRNMLWVSFGLAAFLATYRSQLARWGLDWRITMRELLDTLRPLMQYRIITELEAACKVAMEEEDEDGHAVAPSPDDEAVTQQWMDPALQPRSFHDMCDMVRDAVQLQQAAGLERRSILPHAPTYADAKRPHLWGIGLARSIEMNGVGALAEEDGGGEAMDSTPVPPETWSGDLSTDELVSRGGVCEPPYAGMPGILDLPVLMAIESTSPGAVSFVHAAPTDDVMMESAVPSGSESNRIMSEFEVLNHKLFS